MVLCFVSPVNFNNGNANVRNVNSDGNGNNNDNVNLLYGVRPTLNQIPASLKGGLGTAADPWRIAD